MSVDVRNPCAEAQALLPPGYAARVLEPSPPAIHGGEFADDPTDRSTVDPGTTVVSPVSTGDRSWVAFTEGRGDLQRWASERWLGPWPRLEPLPEAFAATRETLHRFAYFVLAPARHRANTRIGLRYTMGGFGTPFFGDDIQARIDGLDLVVQRKDRAERSGLNTISEACEAVGIAYRPGWFPRFRDPLPSTNPDEPLVLSASGAGAIAALFGFGTWVLEELRATEGEGSSRVQVWPEHFDLAVGLGDPESGARASVGLSPGDALHPEPYLYVSAWAEIDRSNPIWNDPHFNGASFSYTGLVEAEDQRATALGFYRRVLSQLGS